MTKQSTVRLPEDLADDAEAVARVEGAKASWSDLADSALHARRDSNTQPSDP